MKVEFLLLTWSVNRYSDSTQRKITSTNKQDIYNDAF